MLQQEPSHRPRPFRTEKPPARGLDRGLPKLISSLGTYGVVVVVVLLLDSVEAGGVVVDDAAGGFTTVVLFSVVEAGGVTMVVSDFSAGGFTMVVSPAGVVLALPAGASMRCSQATQREAARTARMYFFMCGWLWVN
jgi:hypothetical protein